MTFQRFQVRVSNSIQFINNGFFQIQWFPSLKIRYCLVGVVWSDSDYLIIIFRLGLTFMKFELIGVGSHHVFEGKAVVFVFRWALWAEVGHQTHGLETTGEDTWITEKTNHTVKRWAPFGKVEASRTGWSSLCAGETPEEDLRHLIRVNVLLYSL